MTIDSMFKISLHILNVYIVLSSNYNIYDILSTYLLFFKEYKFLNFSHGIKKL